MTPLPIEAGERRASPTLDDISHELRTPLTVIRGWLAIAADEGRECIDDCNILSTCLANVDRLERAIEGAEMALREAESALEHALPRRRSGLGAITGRWLGSLRSTHVRRQAAVRYPEPFRDH